MKNNLIFWAFIFVTNNCFLDNKLTAQISNKKSESTSLKLVENYQSKAIWYLQIPQFNYDSAKVYFDKSIAILESTKNYELLANVYLDISKNIDIGYGYSRRATSIEKAKYYINKAKKVDNDINFLKYKIIIEDAKDLKTYEGYKLKLDLLLKAAAIIQNDSRPAIQNELIRDKAKIYLFFNSVNVKVAFPYLKQSEKYYELIQSTEELFTVYNDLSWYYNVLGKNDSAQYYFDKQKALLPKTKSPILIESYYTNRANNYMRQKKFELALPLLKKCYEIGKKYKLELSRYYLFNLRLLGIIADQNKNYQAAINYFEESLKGSLAINNVGYQTDCYFFLMDIYPKISDYKKAWEYQKKYAKLAISEAEQTNEKSIRESELQFSILQKDQEISKKQNERNLYLGSLIVGIMLIGLLYRNYRLKQKSNQKLENLNGELGTKNVLLDKKNGENELLLKEIHHRVKNNLEVVSSLLALQSAKMDDPNMQEAMLASQNRVQSMGILHQKLYQSEHLAFIEMKNYFQNLSENILDSYNETDRIKVIIDMDEIELDVDTAVPIGLIVNELFTNALKYAFPTGNEGIIKLTLENLVDGNLHLRVSDNGIGKTLNATPKGTGFGTQLVDLLTRQIDGKLVQEVNNGTIVSINFKRQMAA